MTHYLWKNPEMELLGAELKRMKQLERKGSALTHSERDELKMLQKQFDGSGVFKLAGLLAGITFGLPWLS